MLLSTLEPTEFIRVEVQKAIDVKDGKVLPNQKMTRGEMIKMLIEKRTGLNEKPGYYY